jgi:glycosyltransferase involved in cell wall biosynthesis
VTNNNVKFKGYVEYSKIKKILKKYHIALMPYEKKISARSSNLEIARYISPLKMFDYFSAGNIIFASKIKAFDHILKNNVNSFLLNNANMNDWKISINKVFNNLSKYNYIKYNALQSAKKFSWNNRAKKLLKFVNCI